MARPVPLAHLPATATTPGNPIHPWHSITSPTVQTLSDPSYDPRNDPSTCTGSRHYTRSPPAGLQKNRRPPLPAALPAKWIDRVRPTPPSGHPDPRPGQFGQPDLPTPATAPASAVPQARPLQRLVLHFLLKSFIFSNQLTHSSHAFGRKVDFDLTTVFRTDPLKLIYQPLRAFDYL